MTQKFEPGMAYNMKTLNKVFAILSVALLVTVGWVFLDDYLRPWKAIQIKAEGIKKTKLQEKLAKEEKAINQEKLDKLNEQLEAAKAEVQSKKEIISKIQTDLDLVLRDIKKETIINGKLNSNVAATTFNWEQAHAHHDHKAESIFEKLQVLKKDFGKSNDRKKDLSNKQKDLSGKIEELRGNVINTEKSIDDMVKTGDLLKIALTQTKTFENPVWILRNAPFIDFMDPTVKIQQVVIPQIPDDRYFVKVPKVDRCMTCHTFIGQEGYEDQENPFKTHPNLNLMVGVDSPHSIKKMGCTSCHQGEGHRVGDFTSVAHVPNDPKQKEEWEKKYHYHAPHKVSQPMYRLKDTEASCVKCHKAETYIPGGTVINEGIRNVHKFGCYACHKIEGWEDRRNPGPSLVKIKGKVTKEFFKNWVWDPRSFNKHAKMPSFFNQSNNSKKEFLEKTMVEVNAMAEFIWDISKDYTPHARYYGGNKDKGKKLISEIGCMGCHGVEGLEEQSEKVNAFAGPYLTGTGSKLSGDWLVSWLLKPNHYQADTIMPSLRLSNSEANDIASYLLSLKNKTFEELKFEKINPELRDDILMDYFSAFDSLEVAKGNLAKLNAHEKTIELGKKSVGKYGCYSCHNIDGFDGRAPIGPELTVEGSKPVTQLGFGHENVDHTREGFFYAHMLNPRRWDNGTDKPFKDLNRMPNFYMTEREAQTITTWLLGQVSDFIPLEGKRLLQGHDKIASESFKVLNRYNCIGCHKVDGMFGDITKMYEDDQNEGPPWLVSQGHRVQTDWFFHFLGNVQKIRPWLKLRMPSFNLTSEEKNAIVSHFQHKAKMDTFVEVGSDVDWGPGEKLAAQKLWNSYGCVTCHASGFTNETPTAPNLHNAKMRLRPTWIKEWLSSPQKILPYTPMPNFFEGGVAQDEEILGGNVSQQINALTKLIIDFGVNGYPKALGEGNE